MRMTQKCRVKQYMEDYGSISPMEAFRDLGITCLAERIRDLRQDGIEIKGEKESHKNIYNETVRYCRYSLI